MDVMQIFDAVAAFSAASIKADKIRILEGRIADAKSKSCGHCDHWMKTSCAPEHGQGKFKSSASIACGDFVLQEWVANFTKGLEAELAGAKGATDE